MKKNITRIGFASVLFALLLFFSCKKTPLEGVQVVVDTNFLPSTVDIGVFDASTGEPIPTSLTDIDFSISDRNSEALIIEVSGGELTLTDGFLSVSIKPDVAANFGGDDLLFEGSFSISADGYLPTSLPLLLYDKSRQSIKVYLIRIAALPPGVVWVDDATTITNGVTNNPLDLETGNVAGGSVTVSIPSGVLAKGEDGAPLTSNAVRASATYLSPSAGAANPELFPGGLIARVRKNGGISTTAFATAGLVGMELKSANGNETAACITSQFEIKMEVPTDLINPNTNTFVAVGDAIPLWYLEKPSGAWKLKGDVTTALNVLGNLEVVFQDSLMGYYNLDWEYPSAGCNDGAQLILTSSAVPDSTPIFGELKYYVSNQLLRTESVYSRIGDTLFLPMVPVENMRIDFVDYDGTVLGSANQDFCGASVNFSVTPGLSSTGCSEVFVAGFCPSNPELLFKPTIGYWFREEPLGPWIAGTMVNGNAAFCGKIGSMYTVSLAFDGEVRDTTFTYDATLDLDFGAIDLGTTKYCE